MARLQRLVPLTLVVAALGVLGLVLLTEHSRGSQVVPTLQLDPHLLLVRETRLGPLVLATYRARVINTGPTDVREVTATLIQHPPTMLVLDGHLSFGDVPAGSTRTSLDTFTLLRDRRTPVNSADLVWEIQGTPVTANTPPVAKAGPDQTVFVGQTVTLDGSQSTDIDGDPLQYRWSLLQVPTGSNAALVDSTAVHPTFLVDRPGTFIAELIVNDGTVDSTPDTVSITTQNSRPVANAGPDQSVFVGSTVALDGSTSHDADGDPLQYRWSLSAVPAGSTAILLDPNTVQPSFLVDEPGTYVAQLIVSDGLMDSAPDTVSISTVNSPPVANAGPDQTVLVDTTAQLNGSASSDVDGDALSYRWLLSSLPLDSTAMLSDTTAVTPSFLVDVPGTYVAQLIVSDGQLDSTPDAVTISTANSRPVANAGPDQTVSVGDLVHLDGTASDDADQDPLSFLWALTAIPTGSTATLSDPTSSQPTFVADRPGTYVAQLIVHDGALDSTPDTTMITGVDTRPPLVQFEPPDGALLNTAAVLLRITYQDADSGIDTATVQIRLDGGDVTSLFTVTASGASSQATLADGTHALEISLRDVAGNTAQGTSQFVVDIVPPAPIDSDALTIGPVANGQLTVSGAAGSVEPNAQVSLRNMRTGQIVTVTAAADGSFTVLVAGQQGDVIAVTSTDAAGNTSAPITFTVGASLPPDPATVAPPLDLSVATTLGTAAAFLYTGSTPIQTGVAPGTIDARRVAVLRGTVTDRPGAPLGGVQIRIHNHPEFGQTLSRADGMFDLAVNGGGVLTIDYQKAGFLPAQRQVTIPWQDYVVVADVALIALDPQVTIVDLGASTPIQVAQGSLMQDADGVRQATLLVPQGTTATMRLPNGDTQALTTLTIRATEYTVGPNGPKAMPAILPPTSGYTYAVELSADEAIAAGASDVHFNQPLMHYVENFLNFPVGGIVPVGFYDRTKTAWMPEDNGRVVKILGHTGGLADLDVNGSGQAASAADLAILGVTDAERHTLAGLYQPGQSLWRVPITHFSPWDSNWPFGPPPGAGGPGGSNGPQPRPRPDGPSPFDLCKWSGSIIGCQDQVLGEVIRVTGTPFSLHY